MFQYQLLAILNRRMAALVLALYLAAFLLGRFAAELAIINSELIALGLMADFLRYSLVVVVIISVCHQVSQDYELSQFERLLTMPISRAQYVLAQNLVVLVFVLLLIMPLLPLLWITGNAAMAGYWSLAVLLELLLVGQFAMLAIISLEKLPGAVIFTLAVYLLARLTPVLDVILQQSLDIYQEQQGFQFTALLFNVIQYLMPDASAFAQNNLLFERDPAYALALGRQLLSILVFWLFIQFVLLVDFYRKEFNRT